MTALGGFLYTVRGGEKTNLPVFITLPRYARTSSCGCQALTVRNQFHFLYKNYSQTRLSRDVSMRTEYPDVGNTVKVRILVKNTPWQSTWKESTRSRPDAKSQLAIRLLITS